MKERIKELIDYKGISAGDLAGLLEVQRSNISHILNGRNKPGASLIEKMLQVFPDLNARWLLTGAGDMLDSNKIKKESTEEQIQITEKIGSNETSPEIKKVNAIEKVILFYNDGTFVTYKSK